MLVSTTNAGNFPLVARCVARSTKLGIFALEACAAVLEGKTLVTVARLDCLVGT